MEIHDETRLTEECKALEAWEQKQNEKKLKKEKKSSGSASNVTSASATNHGPLDVEEDEKDCEVDTDDEEKPVPSDFYTGYHLLQVMCPVFRLLPSPAITSSCISE